MKTEGISRLLTALGPPIGSSTNSKASPSSTEKNQRTGSQYSDAVLLTKGFGHAKAQQNEIQHEVAKRQEKVQQLRQQVQAGTYRTASKEVAVAVLKELGI